MKDILYTVLIKLEKTEEELERYKQDYRKITEYLYNKGIILTVHSEKITSELDKENNK